VQAVDIVIGEIVPFLEPGDMLMTEEILFSQTQRDGKELEEKGIYFGMGVSGGKKAL
jgi:6-phosphogluconate dehydrogenase